MRINSLPLQLPDNTNVKIEQKEQGNFKNIFQSALDKVNSLQLEADQQAIDFALGGVQAPDIHNVMISMEKAGLALSLTIEVRNKLLEAYQEIMRMQV